MLNISTSLKDDASILQQWCEMLEAAVIQRPDWILILFLTLLSVIFVVGVIGNLLTCIVIFFDKSMHTATNCYLFILAVSDLLVAFGIILEISGYLYDDTLLSNRIICKIHFFLVVTLFNNGILIMTALAIERYIAIYHPLLLSSKPVWRRVMKIIILIWTAAILETLPEIWTVDSIKTHSFRMCFPLPSRFARWLNSVLGVITFIIPLMIMTFLYAAIALKVNMIPRKNSRDIIFNQRNNRSKVNKLVVALTLSFVVCWLPFFVMRILIFSIDTRTYLQHLQYWDLLIMLSSINSWFSIVLNPILFSLMSTKFRKALKIMWNEKFKRQYIQPNVV